MLGVPEELPCLTCDELMLTHFDDYDIECGNPNPESGEWVLKWYCTKCKKDLVFELLLKCAEERWGDASSQDY